MSVLKSSIIALLALLALSDVAKAQNWRQWLEQRQQRQEQEQQEEEEQADQEPLTGSRGFLKSKLEELRRREQELRQRELLLELQKEREEALQEELEEILGNYELEDLALQLGTDTLGRILRPLREQPTQIPLDDCITKNWEVEFEYGLAGVMMYKVCGSGDNASLQLRFLLPGQTTPAMETTTPITMTTGPATTQPVTTTAVPTTAALTTTALLTASTTVQQTTQGVPDTTDTQTTLSA